MSSEYNLAQKTSFFFRIDIQNLSVRSEFSKDRSSDKIIMNSF